MLLLTCITCETNSLIVFKIKGALVWLPTHTQWCCAVSRLYISYIYTWDTLSHVIIMDLILCLGFSGAINRISCILRTFCRKPVWWWILAFYLWFWSETRNGSLQSLLTLAGFHSKQVCQGSGHEEGKGMTEVGFLGSTVAHERKT